VSIFQISKTWKTAFPGAHAGVLILSEAANPAHHPILEAHKDALEQELRVRYSGQDRAALLRQPVLQAYAAYYGQFRKTYHVQLQLESLLFKGKSIPSQAPLVEAMFMAEMNNLLLTAGHDLDIVRVPITLDAAEGTESYTLLRGEAQIPKAGDMMIVDREGIISSIVYGPDQRTQITAQTRNLLFTVYAPTGIDEQLIRHHLVEIQQNVQLIAGSAKVELLEVYDASSA
jgi:DNA/RNA-binding domain of Phe-tRNA-synthetase-like protein